jgi:hypothetical protein
VVGKKGRKRRAAVEGGEEHEEMRARGRHKEGRELQEWQK